MTKLVTTAFRSLQLVRRTVQRAAPLALLVVTLLLSCSPLVRLQVPFRLPAGMKPDPARLRVTVAKACDERNSDKPKATAPAAPEPGKGGELGAKLEAGQLVFEAQGDSFRCLFQLAAWFDANGNNELDAGDAVGRMPAAVEVVHGGLCDKGLPRAPAVVLRRVSGPGE